MRAVICIDSFLCQMEGKRTGVKNVVSAGFLEVDPSSSSVMRSLKENEDRSCLETNDGSQP